MENRISRINLHKAGLVALIWILAFQSPLEGVWAPFSYIDEVTALFGAVLGVYDIVIVRKGHPSKEQLGMGIPLLAFIVIGLAGNLIYQYQPLKCVIIDLYTNLKFFFAIGTGYYLFASLDWEEMKKTVQWNARTITLILFVLFLIDRIFGLWPCEVRYGIASAKLFYHHPTYLAGAMAFMLVLLTAFYDKKNLVCIAISVILMAFTLRAKSLASAALYVAIFVFFLIIKWRLRLWHVIAAGIGSIAIAWDKIQFYFIDLSGWSARSVILQKSFEVMKDHFPIGSGFGTYGSSEAAKHYSPVYLKYNFNDFWELRDISNVANSLRLIYKSDWHTAQFLENPDFINAAPFLSDHFWPTILGQSGVLGTVVFLMTLGVLLKRCFDVRKFNLYAYVGVLFAMVYLIISSVAEPAFHNSVAIPLAMVIGMVFAQAENTTAKE